MIPTFNKFRTHQKFPRKLPTLSGIDFVKNKTFSGCEQQIQLTRRANVELFTDNITTDITRSSTGVVLDMDGTMKNKLLLNRCG